MNTAYHNPNCDGSGPCLKGEVRVLPLGTSPHHGNIILCKNCFRHEINWRYERNTELSRDCQFRTPEWLECKLYAS
jgi:hypothetical protein